MQKLLLLLVFVSIPTLAGSSESPKSNSLQEALDARKNASKASPSIKAVMKTATQKLKESGLLEKALQAGKMAPAFQLPNAQGGNFSLEDALKKGPVVLAFYRGEWCPYCNMQLHAYQKRLSEFRSLGAELVAVSPEVYDAAKETITKGDLEFPVLTDKGNKVARSYGIVFPIGDDLKAVYQKFGIDLAKNQGNGDWELPLAATYVIGQDKNVVWSFLSADYTQRAEPDEIIKVLKDLN